MTDLLKTLLLERAVLHGKDFLLASGEHSSYYIDARRVTMSADGMVLIGMQALGRFTARNWKPRFVGGMTQGADPVALAIVQMDRARERAWTTEPFIDAFTVRKQAKPYGLRQRIEGCFAFGAPVVVVEDVLTTGRSTLEAIQIVEYAGANVLGVLVVVDREAGGREALEKAGHQVEVLITARELGLT